MALPDFGTDVALLDDLAPVWGLVSGPDCLAQDLTWRLRTPRGRLFSDPNYGTDVRQYLAKRLGRDTVAMIQADISAECEKDERVASADASVEFNWFTRTMTISISVVTAAGPTFTMVIAATLLTVALLTLNVNGTVASAATASTATASGIQFVAGPPGPAGVGVPGPPGPGGSNQVVLTGPVMEDDSGAEVALPQLQWSVNFGDLLPSITVQLVAAVASQSGSAIFRVRVGGADETPDGAIVCTITATTSGYVVHNNSSTITNPNGLQLVKITVQSSAAGQLAQIKNSVITIR